jgi:hypothetical protein
MTVAPSTARRHDLSESRDAPLAGGGAERSRRGQRLPGRPERRVSVLERFGAALRQRQRWLLIWLLLVLHLALVAGAETTIGLLCWLVNVGLFVIWQPFIHAERKVDLGGLAVIALLLGCGVAWYGWWLLIVWVVMLAALVGGRVMFIDHRPTRIFYLVAFAYLLAALLFWLVPQVVPDAALRGPSLDREFAWGMPSFLLLMLLLPVSHASDRAGDAMVDLFYSLFIFLLIAVLVLGSLAFMLLRQSGYYEAVLNTLLSIAGLLLLIGWTWNTRPGYTGIGVFFSRYLLTIGLPFEQWLHRLTTLASSESDAESFLSQALAEMLDLPWVEGGSWVAGARQGTFGSQSRHRHDFPGQPLLLTLHTRHKLSPSLVWHFHLLAQLANEHYIAKVRERELQQVSYLRAIHETGARLTHDVKNLLQSLNNLCYLAQSMQRQRRRAARPAAAAPVAAGHPAPAADARQAAETAERGRRAAAGRDVVADSGTALRHGAGPLRRRGARSRSAGADGAVR